VLEHYHRICAKVQPRAHFWIVAFGQDGTMADRRLPFAASAIRGGTKADA